MKYLRRTFFSGLGLAALFSGAPAAFSQRAFNVAMAQTNDSLVLSWKCQSATRVGDLLILPQFIVQRSDDLQSWLPISSNLTGTLSQKLTFSDTNASRGFYRVQSIINEEYAEIPGAVLDSGELTGADFFGANLFGA